jgi:hypothetical protein
VKTSSASILAAIIGGIAGGLLVWLLTPSTRPPRQATSPGYSDAENRGDVEARIDELERQMSLLRRRAAAREALAAFIKAAQTQEDKDSTGDTSLKTAIDPGNPRFEEAVRGVMDVLRQEEKLARETRRVLRREARARTLTQLLAEELRLTESQQQEVERIFADQYARYRELRRAAREQGRDPLTPRQKKDRKERIKQQIESETERLLDEVLDKDQLELFRRIREAEGIKL